MPLIQHMPLAVQTPQQWVMAGNVLHLIQLLSLLSSSTVWPDVQQQQKNVVKTKVFS